MGMRMRTATLAASFALVVPAALVHAPAIAQASAAIASGKVKPSALSPGEIVAAAPASEWVAIAPSDLLVMTLAPPPRGPGQASHDGNKRQVVIQLMPPPFSQGWIGNIRKLAAAHWWDGLSINRVQDNYVVQWGDANAEDKVKAKALPPGLKPTQETGYTVTVDQLPPAVAGALSDGFEAATEMSLSDNHQGFWRSGDAYADVSVLAGGWPLASNFDADTAWPIHCYGMVGVGRDLSPNTGTGAELYTVIGQAPRHLDRNIALVGRVVEGIENLSSLPRGTGALGFYEKAEQRAPIQSIRLASELPKTEQPKFEYLSTESPTFAKYADARANRRDPFFNVPAGGADICNIPVPVRRVPASGK